MTHFHIQAAQRVAQLVGGVMFKSIVRGAAVLAIIGSAHIQSAEAKPAPAKRAPIAKKAPNWKFTVTVDKFSDERNCRLDAPTQNVILSFQGKKIYVLNAQYIGSDSSIVTLRVDQNAPMDIYFRLINGHLGAIEDNNDIEKIVSQLSGGHVLRARLLTVGGLQNDEAIIDGFSSEYAKFKQCEGI